MSSRILARALRPFAQIEGRETITALLMFSYSFLAMTAYNVIKPATRSKFIESLGAENLPYVQLTAGVLIGLIMAGYSWLLSRLPRRWCLPIMQGGIAALLFGFWYLFAGGQAWVSVAFYLTGLVLGILLISQFWTLANVVYDPRQAKRLFGFIGGGSSLGGVLGSLLVEKLARRVGTSNLLLFSATFMVMSAIVVSIVIQREQLGRNARLLATSKEKGASGRKALQLLVQSKHLRLIALVISFAAIGAAIIDQQLNMAAAASKGRQATDAITIFLAQVQFWTSTIGFVIQVTLTSRIHRYLGIGFALLLLPMSLGTTGLVMLLNAALWAPGLARVLDQSLRYTVDKTTREILYMPLPSDIKFEAKPFVDVTVDRFAKGLSAIMLLVLIKPWGLGLGWQKLSCASIAITGIWIIMALRAKHGYQAAFRQSLENRDMKPAEIRLEIADLSTIEILIQELASPDDRRVLYAIDLLESLDKRHLITPLLLYHDSPAVRVRALAVLGASKAEIGARYLAEMERLMKDESPEVRLAAMGALANVRNQEATAMARQLLEDNDPRIAMTAAMVLAESDREEDAGAAEAVLKKLVFDVRESAAGPRRDFAIAIRHVPVPHFRRLLIPLLHDPNFEVSEEAMRSTRKVGASDFIFVPTLISLLRNRRLKNDARQLLLAYGEQVLGILGHFLRDPEEDIWVRRHIPGTIARIPCQKAMDTLLGALEEPDRFLRFQVIAAIENLHRLQPQLTFKREPIEAAVIRESVQCLDYRAVYRSLFEEENLPGHSLLSRALAEKMRRAVDRTYRLLTLVYPWKDIAAARYTIERGDPRSRAGALEFLDNLLAGPLRKRVMPLLEKARRNSEDYQRAGPSKRDARGLEETVVRLINDDDPVLSAAAVSFAWEQKLRGLVDELERVLATRSAHDWCVFEAVSWVLAAFRMPEARRRALWLEPLPAVGMAERLRGLPLFESVAIDELFRICEAGRQVRYEPDRLLFLETLVPESVQFLLDGQVVLKTSAGETWTVDAPAALGFQEVLEGKPMRQTVRTTDRSVCMALSSEECLTLLADNTELVQGLFKMLCRTPDMTGRLVVKSAVPKAQPVGSGDLKAIEKVLILQATPAFSDVSAEEGAALSSIAVEVPLAPGALLFDEADPPAIYALVRGELSLESPGHERQPCAVAPDVIGFYETLAGIAFDCRARVAREGLALRIDREQLFDMIAQRPDLLRQIFSALFRTRAVQKIGATA